jgi:hypothetical protein
MSNFSQWLEQQEFVEYMQNVFEQGVPDHKKPWSGKKQDILQMWKSLQPDIPVHMEPLTPSQEGQNQSSYGEDGIRITGSKNFIAGVLAKLKEIIGYENDYTRLRLVFKGVDAERVSRKDRQNYVFYINLQPRGRKRKRKMV